MRGRLRSDRGGRGDGRGPRDGRWFFRARAAIFARFTRRPLLPLLRPLSLAPLVALVSFGTPLVARAQRDPSASPVPNRPFATERGVPSTDEAPGARSLDEGAESGERVLPSVPLPSAEELEALGAKPGLVIRELDVVGNTVLDDAALTQAAAPYLGRPIDSADLERIRRALTATYVREGYVSSGARIPEQDVASGRLRVEIVEGRLAEIRIEGLRHYRESILRRRLARAAGPPVRVSELESALRILSQDPRIARLDARLEPGVVVGTSILEVSIEESDPASLAFSADNHQSPSVGSYAGYADLGHRNPLGFGDELMAGVSVSEGLYRVDGRYSIPLHPSGTELFVEGRYSLAEILDPDSDLLEHVDIDNESSSYAVGLTQTLYRTPQSWITADLSLDMRRSKSRLDGDPFPFSEGSENGRSELSVLRGGLAWTRRMSSSALTVRSIASFGLDALGATIQHGSTFVERPNGDIEFEPGDPPDGVFFTWVGQLRYFYRFDSTGIEVDLRGDVQLSDRPLMSLEQFVVGGPGSVRGYRTNALAGDDGFSTGVEVRLPIVSTATGRNIVSVLPFADVGRIRNHARPDPETPTLSSLGAGVEWAPHPKLSFRVDAAGALRDVGPKNDLQDYGVTFRVTWRPR